MCVKRVLQASVSVEGLIASGDPGQKSDTLENLRDELEEINARFMSLTLTVSMTIKIIPV